MTYASNFVDGIRSIAGFLKPLIHLMNGSAELLDPGPRMQKRLELLVTKSLGLASIKIGSTVGVGIDRQAMRT
jgi:hypothetical protein